MEDQINELKKITTKPPPPPLNESTLANKNLNTKKIVSKKQDKKTEKEEVKPAATKNPVINSYTVKRDTSYIENDSLLELVRNKIDSTYREFSKKKNVHERAASSARTFKNNLSQKIQSIANYEMHANTHKLEKDKKYSQAVACMIMFLIGAPLGAIIKKGGLGMPVVVSVFFFIIFYVMTVIADKWAKASVMDGYYAAWVADLVLLPFGILFLYQARKDAKLFDSDFYTVWWQNLQLWWKNKKESRLNASNN